MRFLLTLLCGFCFVFPVEAAVTISEIAWMGTENSANDEWIELHNTDSDPVDVEGWLLSDGANLTINLSGIVPGNTHVVLERTDDGSAPGTAFLIYSGGLSNAGATLTLFDDGGEIVDQAYGGDAWSVVGGDNATKETAQYTSGGWVTAVATPGVAANEDNSSPSDTEDDMPEDDEPDDTYAPVEVKENERSSNVSTLHIEPRTLEVFIDTEQQVSVNEPITFSALAGGVGEAITESLSHEWNFGDTHTVTGETVSHFYAYPGEYVVTLFSAYKDYTAEARKRVLVLPVTLSLAYGSDETILLHNDARYEIDVSGYSVVGRSSFVIPPRTALLPGATLTLPPGTISYNHGDKIVLFDNKEREVFVLQNKQEPESEPQPAKVVATAPIHTSREDVSVESFAFTDQKEEVIPGTEIDVIGSATNTEPGTTVTVGGDGEPDAKERWPFAALGVLIGFSVLAVVASRRT